MSTAQVGRPDDRPQIMRVFHTVAQYQERIFPFGLRRGKQIFQRSIAHFCGTGCHALVVRRCADFLQLVARYPLDYRTALLGQSRIIPCHRLRQRIGQIHGIYRITAFQQFGHRVLAPHQRIGALFCLSTARLFHPIPPAGRQNAPCLSLFIVSFLL